MSVENLVGQTLGPYELRELYGAGGMGAVYRAYQMSLKREVAVKVLPLNLASQPGYIERFTREAEIAAALEHPHIVPIHDYGTQRSISYVVMRLLTGGSLAQRLQQANETNKLPSLGEVSTLLRQIAGALDYAHSRGVIHRDIKPTNVMFDNHGSAYLVDFGIAKLLSATSALTSTGVALGTPAYMPPEQWRDEEITPAADQYALGVLVYAMTTGRLPFEASTPFALMHKHLSEAPTPPQAWRGDLPHAVTLVLERALAKTPGERFPTITGFSEAFSSAVSGIEGKDTGFFLTNPLPRPTPPVWGASRTNAPTVTPPPAGAPPVPPTGGAQTVTPPPAAAAPAPSRRGLLVGLVAGALAVAAIAIVALFVLPGMGSGAARPTADANPMVAANLTATADALAVSTDEPTVNPTEELAAVTEEATVAIAAAPTETEAPPPTETAEPTASATPEPTNTDAPTDTAEPTATASPTATETPTETPEPTATATPMPTDTPAPTATEAPVEIAPLSGSSFEFAEAPPGSGWGEMEGDSSLWTAQERATIYLLLKPDVDYSLKFSTVDAASPALWDSLTVYVEDVEIPLAYRVDAGNARQYEGVIPASAVQTLSTALTFQTDSVEGGRGILFDWLRIEPRVQAASNPTPVPTDTTPAEPLPFEVAQRATLEDGAGERWTFSGSEGDPVMLSMSSPEFDAFLELFGPDGSSLATADDTGGGTNAFIYMILPQTGDYTVLARSFDSDATGNYTMYLRRLAGRPGVYNGRTPEQVIRFLTNRGILDRLRGRLNNELTAQIIDLTGFDDMLLRVTLSDTFTDFVMGATIHWGPGATEDTCGFSFRETDSDNYYVVEIDRDGTLWFIRRLNGEWAETQQASLSGIRTGRTFPNEMILIARGDTFRVIINETSTQTFTDATLTSGVVGLEGTTFDESDESRCIFRDVWVWDLE